MSVGYRTSIYEKERVMIIFLIMLLDAYLSTKGIILIKPYELFMNLMMFEIVVEFILFLIYLEM